MNEKNAGKLTLTSALRLEFAIIGIGILALLMIFQPFSLWIFSIGCGLVVFAALANNLLPLLEPGAPLRKLAFAASVVLLIFCTAILVSMGAAYLYGLIYLKGPSATSLVRVPARPFWEHSLFWGLIIIDVILWITTFKLAGRK